jgi:hypothetical protein
VALTDFSLNDFRGELFNHLDTMRETLENAPLGLYAVVPTPGGDYAHFSNKPATEIEKQVIKPGVIFCLRQKEDNHSNEKINPLHPYFLVYVSDNGIVQYHYTHAKQILEIFKCLCEHQDKPYEFLCQLFNEETQYGENMAAHVALLKTAVDELVSMVKNKGQQSLLSSRSGVLISAVKQISCLNDFELITWLVIK